MSTNESEIPADLYARVEKAYANLWFLNQKEHEYEEGRMKHDQRVISTKDLGRQPVEIVRVKENVFLVIDQPRNFRDYFSGPQNAWGVRGAATAIKMRNFYACRRLIFIADKGWFLENAIWKGGHLSKDAEKSVKQFNKFKESVAKGSWELLNGEII